jgi:acyl-[acyl-carrier-protein]-phospholipid O-acyltransferase/long-chain-fatty-acid--[acyl-carrier-protein] ligase
MVTQTPSVIGTAASERDAPLRLRSFWALIVTQFQGAFSDNALKWLVSFLILEAGYSQDRRDFLFVLVVPLLFAVPFLLFSIPGGYLADRFSKRSVTIWTKVFELAVMALAAFALWHGQIALGCAAVFLACTQGAIFGPTKYGLLPELLPTTRLSWGNGIIELTTLLAAITAALASGFLAEEFRGRQLWSGAIFITLTLAGLLSSMQIDRIPAADPARTFPCNWPEEFLADVRRIRGDRALWMAILANTYFWFLGALLLLNVVLYSTDVLHADEAHSGYLLAALSLGIGMGSFASGLASGKRIETGMVLPALAAVMLFSALLGIPGLHFAVVAWLLFAVGMAGGFFVVPLNALIQHRPAAAEKGRILAVANLLSFGGVALQPVAQYAMIRLGHPDPERIFLIAAGMSLVAGAGLALYWPGLGARALCWTRLWRSATL